MTATPPYVWVPAPPPSMPPAAPPSHPGAVLFAPAPAAPHPPMPLHHPQPPFPAPHLCASALPPSAPPQWIYIPPAPSAPGLPPPQAVRVSALPPPPPPPPMSCLPTPHVATFPIAGEHPPPFYHGAAPGGALLPSPSRAPQSLSAGSAEIALKKEVPTPWLDPESGAVNVRVLLLKSRDIRRKLRAALHHAARPQSQLNTNERTKAARVSDFQARLVTIDAAARECGMLPPQHLLAEHAQALRGGSSETHEAAVVPGGDDNPALWSSRTMRGVFLVTPSRGNVRTAEENFVAALELLKIHGQEVSPSGVVSSRDDIFAVLYRKFVLSVDHHNASIV